MQKKKVPETNPSKKPPEKLTSPDLHLISQKNPLVSQGMLILYKYSLKITLFYGSLKLVIEKVIILIAEHSSFTLVLLHCSQ